MRKILIVVDMQNDFVTGALGSEDAQKILPGVRAKIMKESICRFHIVSRGQTDGRSVRR